MSSYNTYNISDELVYEDGDVIIRIGTTSNSVFSVHSAVLKKNSSFYHAALSDRWKKPSELLINGTKRQVWEYDMMFDYDLQLPLVNAKVSFDLHTPIQQILSNLGAQNQPPSSHNARRRAPKQVFCQAVVKDKQR